MPPSAIIAAKATASSAASAASISSQSSAHSSSPQLTSSSPQSGTPTSTGAAVSATASFALPSASTSSSSAKPRHSLSAIAEVSESSLSSSTADTQRGRSSSTLHPITAEPVGRKASASVSFARLPSQVDAAETEVLQQPPRPKSLKANAVFLSASPHKPHSSAPAPPSTGMIIFSLLERESASTCCTAVLKCKGFIIFRDILFLCNSRSSICVSVIITVRCTNICQSHQHKRKIRWSSRVHATLA